MSRKQRNQSKSQKLSNTELDIVICVFGRFDLLKRCLEAIPEAAGDVEYKIILVDNASPDKEEADAFYSELKDKKYIIVRNRTNMGFPRACNLGARKYFSPYLFFLNDDVFLRPNAIKLMLDEFKKDDKVGVAGMKLIFPPNSEGLNQQIRPPGKIQHIGLECNIQGTFIHSFVGWSEDHFKVNAQRDVYAVTGAALMTKRSLWKTIGGFNEAYGMGTWEDVDYCLSIRDIGYNIIVVPEAVGTHFVGATAEHYKMPYPMEMNRLLFVQRWGSRLNYTEYVHW